MNRWLVFGLMLLLLVGCVPYGPGEGDGLQYNGPIERGIEGGEFLPGTNIQYLTKTEDGARVAIGGQEAVKKSGDSLNWAGDLFDGAAVDLALRVTLITETDMRVVGTVQIDISDPAPVAGQPNTGAPISYKVPVAYHVEKNGTIPGSVVTYLAKTDEGAQLGNIEGYAYRRLGDSITWKGQLRDRVWIELDLRTVLITDDALDLAGTAELWFAP
jgi:hypothetical protein